MGKERGERLVGAGLARERVALATRRDARGVDLEDADGGRIDESGFAGLTPSGRNASITLLRGSVSRSFEPGGSLNTSPVWHTNKKGPAQMSGALFVCMAHRGGFEPPTSWFVARCSIQLSYRCGTLRRWPSRGAHYSQCPPGSQAGGGDFLRKRTAGAIYSSPASICFCR